MADDDSNLVSEIQITGADKAQADIKNLADSGSQSFDKLASSVDAANQKIADSTVKATKSITDMGRADPGPTLSQRFADIGAAASKMSDQVGSGVSKVTDFGKSVAAIGAVGLAAVAGIAKFASSVTAAARSAGDAGQDLLEQQKQANKQFAAGAGDAAQYQSQIRGLNRQVALGNIDYKTYTQQVNDLNFSYKESVKVQQEVQAAQAEALKANQALERQASQKQAFQDLANTYGTVLANSLIRLGTVADRVGGQLRDGFGPVLASIVDTISGLIEKNSANISKFISTAATALQKFFDDNKTSFGDIITGVGTAVTTLLDVITSVVIPGFRALMVVLDQVAAAVNAVFGTNITGQFILIAGILATVTGAFSAFFGVLQIGAAVITFLITTLGAIPAAIALIVVAFGILLATVDWKAFAANALDAGAKIVAFFTGIPDAIKNAFQAVFDFLLAGYENIKTAIIAAFTSAFDTVRGLFNSFVAAALALVQPLLDTLKTIASLVSSAGGDNNGQGFSGGGRVRGAGSSTSDSIPAWLSNNEFVVRAKSVAKYGVGFLRALNEGKIDLGAIAQYAMGGLVAMPTSQRTHFATGGLAQLAGPNRSGRTLNLTIGGETFSGLIMPDDVGDKMTTFATSRQVRSAGRKPSWVGGKR